MASSGHNLGTTFRQLRWKLTLSYTAVTVGALLVVVLILGGLLLSRVLLPTNLLTPKVWVELFLDNIPPAWTYALAQSPVDTELLSRMLEEAGADEQIQITYFDMFRAGDLRLTARTMSRGDIMIVGPDGVLLAASRHNLFPREAVGQEIDRSRLPGLEGPLQAALSGETDPQRLFVTLEPNRSLFFVVPLRAGGQERDAVLGAAIVYLEALPTQSDIPTNALLLAARILLLLLLAAGLVGAIFGAITANGMVKRFERMSRASAAWSHGDFSEFIEDGGQDEIGQLARHLDGVAAQLQDLLNRRQEMAVAEERNRLARDLHDSAKQQALAASFQLGTALTLFERDPEAAQAHLVEAEGLLDAVRTELTGLIEDLRPAGEGEQGPDEALSDYAREWAHQNGIRLELDVDCHDGLPLATRRALLRITQEGLANVARHSRAGEVSLHVECDPARVVLSISDDGCGFDTSQRHQGLGLQSMRERAEALDGSFSIESSREGGTRLRVELPAV
jgi:NarL family two-component system sensor histidine kinase LiaS